MPSITKTPFEIDDMVLVTKDIYIIPLGSKPYLTKGSLLKVIKTDYYTTDIDDYNMMALLIENNNYTEYRSRNLYMIIKTDVDNGSIINRQKLRQQNIDQIIYETT